jgi:hypothetical protein
MCPSIYGSTEEEVEQQEQEKEETEEEDKEIEAMPSGLKVTSDNHHNQQACRYVGPNL